MGAAIVANTAAIIAINEAHKAECYATIQAFDSRVATVEQQQGYASCIDFVHPREVTHSEAVVLKIVIALVLLSIPFGAWRGYSKSGDWEGTLMMGLLWPMGVASAVFILFLVIAGAAYILS